MLSVLGFLIILGPLVVVHEFGHYFFARLFGVKAEVFSIGFGPRLWHKQLGETDVRLSAIPLGGYVKLLGEDREAPLSPEEHKRALHSQVPWKRFFIFFGGPLFNFLFAILIFMAILLIGEPQVAGVAGRVVHGSAAEQAGFRSGDRILSVNGKAIRKFEEIAAAINDSPGRAMDFEVLHRSNPAPVHVTATPSAQTGFSVYGESTSVGEIDGLMPAPRAAVIGVSDPGSAAAKAGLKTGDLIVEAGGKAVADWEIFEEYLATVPPGAKVHFKIKRGKPETFMETDLVKPESGTGSEALWGLHSSELFVEKALPASPAERAGIKPGDRLIAVGTREVRSFFELKDLIQKTGEQSGKIPLRWEHEGKRISAELTPTTTETRDALLKKVTQYTVGVAPMLVFAEPVTILERTWNPLTLAYKGTERMITFTWRNFVSVGKMFTGEVSAKTLGGPILIGKIAGESISRGLISFLSTMAMLSIGLGVLNVLPVPVLDGGHILLLGLESIRRKPLTLRQMERVQGFGLVLVLALMGFVLFNDLSRLSSF